MSVFGKQKADKEKRNRMYDLPFGMLVLYTGEGAGIGSVLCWLCYNDGRFFPLAGVVTVAFVFWKKKQFVQKQKRVLLYHFKDGISALHTALRAGYSVENAIVSAAKDMEMLYGDSDILSRELHSIVIQLKVQKRVEDLFYDLGERSELPDIKMFAELLAVGKKTGGNIGRLLQQISGILCDRIDTKQEIDAILSSKVFEQKIMSLMPACIIVYLRLTFTGFIEVLYGNAFGNVVFTLCLIIYLAAFFWGKKIVNIEVC